MALDKLTAEICVLLGPTGWARNVGKKKTAILRCVKIPKSSADLIYIAEEAFNHAKLTVVQLVKRLESSST